MNDVVCAALVGFVAGVDTTFLVVWWERSRDEKRKMERIERHLQRWERGSDAESK